MIFALLLAALAFIAAIPILVPLIRSSRPVPGRSSYDQAVYKDQLRELDRDMARGLLSADQAETARLEIQRRLLSADRLPPTATRLSGSPVLAGILFLFVTGGGLGFYLWTGQPGLPDLPFSARKAELAGEDQQLPLRRAAEELAAKLRQNPSDADGWSLYGRSLAMLGEYDKAADAYGHAIALGRATPDILGARGEMLVLQAGGTVTPAAEAAFHEVLKADRGNPVARFYLAAGQLQGGEPKRAIVGWQHLLADLPNDSAMRGQIGQMIEQAAQQAGIPTPELAAGRSQASAGGTAAVPDEAASANLPDDQRMAMISGMVASLAAKQDADPTNFDGWMRLGQAYAVLKQGDKAADAYEKAAALRPGDTSVLLQEAQSLLSNQDPTSRLTPREMALLRRIQAVQPNQPMVLWYLGLNAAQSFNADDARRYWTSLQAQLPAGSQDAKMIEQALDALPKPSSGG